MPSSPTTTPTPTTPQQSPLRPKSNTNTPPRGSPKSPRLSIDDEDLPDNVDDASLLETLPPECLSGNPARPLRHVDDRGREYSYALKPMLYSVAFILVVELLERFSFYGIYYTQTLYLTGVYNEDWNAGLSSVDAAAFVSTSTAVAYTTPFIGAILADAVWGDYYSILIGAVGLYLPGVLMVALTSVPYLLGDTFNKTALTIAVLMLWPLGTGIVKSVVNVFGAKQFHPLLQSKMIESYYVNFYTSINIGALAGITFVPMLAQRSVSVAYFLPVSLLTIGIIVFFSGTPRYVISGASGNLFRKQPKNSDNNNNDLPTISLFTLLRISLCIVPFCVAYNQMPTTFVVQGTVMNKFAGVIDAATMNGLDPVSVLFFGSVTGNVIYPALARRHIKIKTTHKFAMGSFLAACAVLWAILVDHWIHVAYDTAEEGDDGRISVIWQAPAYILIGWGEIFAVSAAYEAAFTASSPDKKSLASAINIFCVGGIPNFICIALYKACKGWFTNAHGDNNLQHIEDYATASVGNYFWVLFVILCFGITVNLSPWVSNFVASTEELAVEITKTPIMRKPKASDRKGAYADEESPLLSAAKYEAKRQEHYMKFAKQPELYRHGSMRAGPSLGHKETKIKKIKKKFIHMLYGGTDSTTTNRQQHHTPTSSTLIPPRKSPRPKKDPMHHAESFS